MTEYTLFIGLKKVDQFPVREAEDKDSLAVDLIPVSNLSDSDQSKLDLVNTQREISSLVGDEDNPAPNLESTYQELWDLSNIEMDTEKKRKETMVELKGILAAIKLYGYLDGTKVDSYNFNDGGNPARKMYWDLQSAHREELLPQVQRCAYDIARLNILKRGLYLRNPAGAYGLSGLAISLAGVVRPISIDKDRRPITVSAPGKLYIATNPAGSQRIA